MILACVPNLMDRSKVAAAAPEARFVKVGADVSASPGDTVVIDLAAPEALAAVTRAAAAGARVIAFGSHVDREGLDAARAGGATIVLARSAFFGNLPASLIAPG